MDDNPKIEESKLKESDANNRSLFDDPFIGYVIEDRYKIIELIGTGGWGKVYKARHLSLDMDLAVKIVHQHHLQDELSIKRFEQEAQLLSKVDNPHVVRIIDYGLTPSPFIVMEYVQGVPLSKWLKTNGSMPAEMAIDFFMQLCEALAAAEAIRIVHRDLKPANILLKTNTENIDCKILDFGLAKFVDMNSAAERLTNTGEILGSPAYMSPEQWKGQCDNRSDIYSLGCIMYETLAGQPPFTAQFGLEYMSKHVSDRPPAISKTNATVKFPQGLEDIINKCLQKSPSNRYQTSSSCREDLLKLKAGGKPNITILEKIKSKASKKAIIAGYLTLLLLAAGYFLSQSMVNEYDPNQERGKYFDKKTYSNEALPKFSQVKDKLPRPVLEGSPAFIDLYWKAWELAFQNLKKPPPGSPLVSNYTALIENIWQWDSTFIMMFGRYAADAFPFIQSLDNFYARQYENGYITQVISSADGEDKIYKKRDDTVNPPLFAWAEWEYAKLTGDKSRFARVMPVLEKHAEWLEKNRRKAGTVHGLYWNTRAGSGMDTTPRSGSGWVDMSAQMALTYKCMAEIANELGNKKSALEYSKQAEKIASAMNRFMWNETDGLYYDVDDQGKQNPCKSIACFWPIIAGVSKDNQVVKMMQNLKDPKSFWRPDVFPSLAADQERYGPDEDHWNGAVWAPANVMIVKGLDNYPQLEGQGELASKAVERYLSNMYEVYKQTGSIWQSYSAEKAERTHSSNSDFVGWSGLGPIQLLIEDLIGIQADGLHKSINWRLSRTDRHGIENLHFGGITASLICSKRENTGSPVELSVITDKPFELQITGDKDRIFQVPAGKNFYHLD